MKLPTKSQVTLVLSILLNVLGALDLIDPPFASPAAPCAPAPVEEAE